MKNVLCFVIFASSLFAQGLPTKNQAWVHYVKEVRIPKHGPDTITIVYDDLYPGQRSQRGGCWFMDMTKPGSPIPMVEDKPDHVTVRGVREHVIKYDCNWIVGKP